MSRGDIATNGNFSSVHDDPKKAHHYGVEDVGWQALAPAIGCMILSTTVVAMRWYTRYKLARCQGWDDYVILLSVVSQNLISATTSARSNHIPGAVVGNDSHDWTGSTSRLRRL
jgi:hypothetical protein